MFVCLSDFNKEEKLVLSSIDHNCWPISNLVLCRKDLSYFAKGDMGSMIKDLQFFTTELHSRFPPVATMEIDDENILVSESLRRETDQTLPIESSSTNQSRSSEITAPSTVAPTFASSLPTSSITSTCKNNTQPAYFNYPADSILNNVISSGKNVISSANNVTSSPNSGVFSPNNGSETCSAKMTDDIKQDNEMTVYFDYIHQQIRFKERHPKILYSIEQ